MLRQYELKNEHIKSRFGKTHIKRIHKHIFQDIYQFGGMFRIKNISKGSTEFCESEFIEENLDLILKELKNDIYSKGLQEKQFSIKAAY